MADQMSKEKRSYTMSKIRARGNASTELKMMGLLKENRIAGWRRHQKLPGNPDFVFRKEKVALFIDGCFWHKCPKCFIPPKSNKEYWTKKIANNRARDRRINKELRGKGWEVVRIWEHSLKRPKWVVNKLKRALDNSKKI